MLQPRQLLASAVARLCDLPDGPVEIGYGGARGGGKSHWAVAQLTEDCLRYPGLKCLLLRKVGKSNKENFGDLISRILNKRRVKYKYSEHKGVLSFGNGATIILGHFQNENDIDAYLGLEYDVIVVEEATTLSASKYKKIQTCNRTSKPGWRPRMYSTTNPGGIGHAWYKARFVTPSKLGTQGRTYFVPATVDDNDFVNEEYRTILDSMTGWELRAWRFGDWDIAAGQFFTTFRQDVHVVKDIDLASNWRKWGALDYGFTHFTAFHLFAKDSDGNILVVDEHGERGWHTERHAEAIKQLCARHRLTPAHLWKIVAGADVFAKKLEGGTVAEAYRKKGIRLEVANDDRINGAAQILRLLGDVDAKDRDGKPKPITPRLFIHQRCARLIETLPAMEHDEHRPEDVLKVDCDNEGLGGDDFYDDFRYGVMAAVTKPENPIYRPGSASATLARAA